MVKTHKAVPCRVCIRQREVKVTFGPTVGPLIKSSSLMV
jgi:hypothetical protein